MQEITKQETISFSVKKEAEKIIENHRDEFVKAVVRKEPVLEIARRFAEKKGIPDKDTQYKVAYEISAQIGEQRDSWKKEYREHELKEKSPVSRDSSKNKISHGFLNNWEELHDK